MPVPPTSLASPRRTCMVSYPKYSSYTPRCTACRHSSLERSYTRNYTDITSYRTHQTSTSQAYSSLVSKPPRPIKIDINSSISSDVRSRLPYNYSGASSTRGVPTRTSFVKDNLDSPSRYKDVNDSRDTRYSLREPSESRDIYKGRRSRESSVNSRDSGFISSSSRDRSASRDYSAGTSAVTNGCFEYPKIQQNSLYSGQAKYQSSSNVYRERKTPPIESASSRIQVAGKVRPFQKQLSEPSNIPSTAVTSAFLSQRRDITSTKKTNGKDGRLDVLDNLSHPNNPCRENYPRSEVTINGNISTQESDDDDDDDDDDNGNTVSVTELRRYDTNQNLQSAKKGLEKSSSESDEDAQSTSSASSGSDSSSSSRRTSPTKEMNKEITNKSASGSSNKKVSTALPSQGDKELQGMTNRISRLRTSSPSNSSDVSDYSPSNRCNKVVRGTAQPDSESPVIPASPRLGRWAHRDATISNRGGLVGLRNLGNTCFMNSVLQCLSNTKLLLEYIRREDYVSDINVTVSSMKGLLIKAFRGVIIDLWKEAPDEKVVNTTAFKSQIQRFAPRFMGYNQQDAQEFLRYLLEGLHEDVNRVTSKPKPITADIDENLSDSQKAIESWKRYIRHDDSKIVDIFVGQLKSTLKCTVCGHCSVTFDPFWDLSLPIPNRTGQVQLQQCFDLFTKEEVLDGDEKPTCSKCQCRRKCTKSFSIQKFPKILVLHLKRFSPVERFRGKLKCTVDFPLTGLDLNAYAANKGHDCTYNLYGVGNHSGTTYSGHYTAYCKHPYSNEWHEYNDSRIHATSSYNVVSNEAYLLFYELPGHCSRL